MSPAHGTHPIDTVFEVDVRADTDGESANAAEADVSFDPKAMIVEKIATDGSVLSLWPTAPEYSNTKGTVRFSGTSSGSFNAKDALLIRITFRATSILPGDVHIDSGALLKNDARATNIITSMRSALFTIVAHQAAPLPEAAPEDATTTPAQSEALSPEVKGASIQVPTIRAYDDHITVGGRIALQGTAAPNTSVTLFLQHDDDTPSESIVRTTSDGAFTYVAPDPASAGVYRAWAEARTQSESFSSDKVIVTVTSAGFATAAYAFTPALAAALALLIVFGGVLGYIYNRRVSNHA